MKAASVPDVESWSHGRGIQEADTEFLLISVALISLHSCLQKCLKERLSGRVLQIILSPLKYMKIYLFAIETEIN